MEYQHLQWHMAGHIIASFPGDFSDIKVGNAWSLPEQKPLNLQIFGCVDVNILTRTSSGVSRRKPTQAWVTPRGFLRCGSVGLVNSLSHSPRRRAPGWKSAKIAKMQSRKLGSPNFKAVIWRFEEGHQYKVTKMHSGATKRHFELCQQQTGCQHLKAAEEPLYKEKKVALLFAERVIELGE